MHKDRNWRALPEEAMPSDLRRWQHEPLRQELDIHYYVIPFLHYKDNRVVVTIKLVFAETESLIAREILEGTRDELPLIAHDGASRIERIIVEGDLVERKCSDLPANDPPL